MKKPLLLLFVLLSGFPFTIAHANNDCNYAALPDKEFIFREFPESLQHYGYSFWSDEPYESTFDSLDYESYVGKKGKLQTQKIKSGFSSWYAAILETCEKIYIHKDSLIDIENYGDIYYLDTLNHAKSLVGKKILVNLSEKNKDQLLFTDDSSISYPITHLEQLEIMGVYTKLINHARGAGSFYLIVKKKNGEKGYLPFNNQYFFNDGIEQLKTVKISGKQLSLNLDADSLPQNYKGDEVFEKLFSKFEKLSKKDEYESSSNYLLRIQDQIDDNIYAFVVKDYGSSIFTKYNADQQVFSVEFSPLPTQPFLGTGRLGKERQSIEISLSIKRNKDYSASNAFGVSTNVESSFFEIYSLAINNNFKSESIFFSMPPEEARILGNNNIGILFVCKIHKPTELEPIAYNDYFRIKPTINKPEDVRSIRHQMVVDLYQIWLFDKTSGKVFTKHPI